MPYEPQSSEAERTSSSIIVPSQVVLFHVSLSFVSSVIFEFAACKFEKAYLRRMLSRLPSVLRLTQWRIQLWAVRAAAPRPIDQNLGLVMAARLRHGGKFSNFAAASHSVRFP